MQPSRHKFPGIEFTFRYHNAPPNPPIPSRHKLHHITCQTHQKIENKTPSTPLPSSSINAPPTTLLPPFFIAIDCDRNFPSRSSHVKIKRWYQSIRSANRETKFNTKTSQPTLALYNARNHECDGNRPPSLTIAKKKWLVKEPCPVPERIALYPVLRRRKTPLYPRDLK